MKSERVLAASDVGKGLQQTNFRTEVAIHRRLGHAGLGRDLVEMARSNPTSRKTANAACTIFSLVEMEGTGDGSDIANSFGTQFLLLYRKVKPPSSFVFTRRTR